MMTSPPAADEVEVSVFGPGVGESLLIHVGSGDWLVIDSCKPSGGAPPFVLSYLQSLGVSVATAVKVVAVTHFHDDHMRGVSEIFAAASSAELVLPFAMQSPFMKQLVSAGVLTPSALQPRTRELCYLLQEVKAKGRKVRLAKEGQVLFRRHSTPDVEVTALSPTDDAVIRAISCATASQPAAGGFQRGPPEVLDNLVATAMHIRVGKVELLLGADLENGHSDREGWQGVNASTVTPAMSAECVKVPHHGSADANDPCLWGRHVAPSSIGVVTPFRRRNIPSPRDIALLKTSLARVFSTASSAALRPRPRPRAVIRSLSEIGAEVRPLVSGGAAHVRIRLEASSGRVLSTECFGSAREE